MTVNRVGVGRVAPFLQAGDIDSGGYWRALNGYKWMLLIAGFGTRSNVKSESDEECESRGASLARDEECESPITACKRSVAPNPPT